MAKASIIEHGTRFGKLVVIKEAERRRESFKPHRLRRYFFVACDCGSKIEVRLSSLLSGNTLSCGCSYKIIKCLDCSNDFEPLGGSQKYCDSCSLIIQKDKTKERNRSYYQNNKESEKERRRVYYRENHAIIRSDYKETIRGIEYRFSYSVRNSAKRKKEWSITFEQYKDLILKPCHYCGGGLNETAIGLDRLDHRFGYLYENVVPCCKKCNFRKGNLESAGFTYPRTVELMKELQELLHAGKVEGSANRDGDSGTSSGRTL